LAQVAILALKGPHPKRIHIRACRIIGWQAPILTPSLLAMSYSGTCKTFNDTKGWGFITSDGNDVFVHIKDCAKSRPQTGDTLYFDLDETKATQGQMKAINVTGGTAPLESAMDGYGKGCKGMDPWGKGGGKGGWGGKGAAQGTGSFQGTVKSFADVKGWGFIDYQGTDVFVHIKDCLGNPPKQGDMLRFDMEENPAKPGSMKAKNVTGGTGWPQFDKGCGKGMKGGYGPAFGGGDAWGSKGGCGGYGGGCGGDAWGGKGGCGGCGGGYGGGCGGGGYGGGCGGGYGGGCGGGGYGGGCGGGPYGGGAGGCWGGGCSGGKGFGKGKGKW